MVNKKNSVSKFILGVCVGYFIIYPAVHSRWNNRYDDLKNLFHSKKIYANESQELDSLTLDAFKNNFGEKQGQKIFNEYKSNSIKSNSFEDFEWQNKTNISHPINRSKRNSYSNDKQNNRSNQLNPNNDKYYQSRGMDEKQNNNYDNNNSNYSQSELDNHANQMNPNNDAYHSSRGK